MGRSTDEAIECRLLWKLARRHAWGAPVPREQLIREALDASQRGRGNEILDALLEESFVGHRPGAGLTIPNSPDEQAKLAYRLRDECGFTELQIEATLSRFSQRGGFDAYDPIE